MHTFAALFTTTDYILKENENSYNHITTTPAQTKAASTLTSVWTRYDYDVMFLKK